MDEPHLAPQTLARGTPGLNLGMMKRLVQWLKGPTKGMMGIQLGVQVRDHDVGCRCGQV